jgi:hypothetical protein
MLQVKLKKTVHKIYLVFKNFISRFSALPGSNLDPDPNPRTKKNLTQTFDFRQHTFLSARRVISRKYTYNCISEFDGLRGHADDKILVMGATNRPQVCGRSFYMVFAIRNKIKSKSKRLRVCVFIVIGTEPEFINF